MHALVHVRTGIPPAHHFPPTCSSPPSRIRGIHVRSQQGFDANGTEGWSSSARTRIVGNRIEHAGQSSCDFGGLSVIAYSGAPSENSTIAHNGVRDIYGAKSFIASGEDGEARGQLVSPYMSFGVYLDNEASGYTLDSNVIVNTERASIFYHYGHDNVVRSSNTTT